MEHQPMKIQITLNGLGGRLDSQIIDASDNDIEISKLIKDAIAQWVLAPGDTITIVEVDC